MKYLLFDAANTLIYKPNLWERILKVLQDNGYKINETELKLRHKLLSEIINFPDTTSRGFYEEFNSELLMALGIIPNENLLKELFEACSYLPWQAFDDCEEIKKLDIKKAVVSNFNSSLQEKLEGLIGENIFDEYIVSEKENLRKPSLEFYVRALEKLNAKASEIIYIGDSLKLDVIPAKKLGIKALLIDRDNIYPSAKDRITNFSEIKNYL